MVPARRSALRWIGLACPLIAGLVPGLGLGRAHAQPPRIETRFVVPDSRLALPGAGAPAQARSASLLAGGAFLASAAVPGAGQLVLREDRGLAYLAVELWAWRTYLNRRAQGRDLEQRYRDLAWSVARRVSVGERRDTVFEYYEAMTKWPASGAYDRNPTAQELVPEVDPRSFNGHIWNLASALFMPPGGAPRGSPEYERALEYYRRHAVPPRFAWAWGTNDLEQQIFAGLIHESDAAFRAGGRMLGVLLANHVVSAVDALIAARLRSAEAPLRLRIGTELDPSALAGLRWWAGIAVPR